MDVIEHDLPRSSSDVVFSEVQEGGVLLSTRDEVYYGLNEVACVVWKLLPEARDLDDLCDRVVRHYPDVNRDTVEEDVSELLESLEEYGLVRRSEDGGAS